MRVFAALFFTFGATCALAGEINPDSLDQLPEAEIYVLGEIHDNPQHHANQSRAVEAIAPAAIVFEMMNEDQANRITPELLDDRAALQDALDWAGSGWPDFGMYYPIFVAAPEAQFIGAGVPRTAIDEAMRNDVATAFGTEAERFGLQNGLPPNQQEARETLQMEAHCNALPESALPTMVDIQRLRDASLARAALDALQATGGPVVIITGNGHARNDWGVPHLLSIAAPDVGVLSIGQLEESSDENLPYDLYIVSKSVEREDPCLAFQ